MNVEKLIESLQEMDPSANVVLESESDHKVFALREALDDDNGAFVILLRGAEIPMRVED
jgi:hypothetical protein